MRKRPDRANTEMAFIEGAKTVTEIREDSSSRDVKKDNYQRHVTFWPLDGKKPNPIFSDGGSFPKPLSLPLKDYEWQTINNHINKLGLKKTQWIKHAMFLLLETEQKILNDSRNS